MVSDIDECKAETDECSDDCVNNIGSYSCSCDLGYELDSDARTCVGKKHM